MQSRLSGSRLPTPVGVVGSTNSAGTHPGAVACRALGTQGFDDIIRTAARREGLDESLVKAVVAAESNFNPKAVSPVGAKGLMQLTDGTAKILGVKDPFDPVANVKGGARFLRSMLDKFGSIPLALAAYNAGPGAVEQYGGVPPYSETKAYINKVMRLQQSSVSQGPRSREEGSNGGHPIG